VLAPLGLLLLPYLSSSEPDLSEVPPGSRPSGVSKLEQPQVFNLGLRVGAAIRGYRREAAGSGSTGRSGVGWHLPPHIRSAHWRRSRVAGRDEKGELSRSQKTAINPPNATLTGSGHLRTESRQSGPHRRRS
jgi:hypothetical protein